jgi:hypothetical protein
LKPPKRFSSGFVTRSGAITKVRVFRYAKPTRVAAAQRTSGIKKAVDKFEIVTLTYVIRRERRIALMI